MLRIFFTISSENLTVDQDKAFTSIIIMLISNTLLGNLLKEVKRNNMLITLELKKKSASFQILPTLPPQKFTNFPRPVLFRAWKTYFKHRGRYFQWRLYLNHFCDCCSSCCCLILIPFCKQWTNYIGKINSTNGRMRATRFILKALEG